MTQMRKPGELLGPDENSTDSAQSDLRTRDPPAKNGGREGEKSKAMSGEYRPSENHTNENKYNNFHPSISDGKTMQLNSILGVRLLAVRNKPNGLTPAESTKKPKGKRVLEKESRDRNKQWKPVIWRGRKRGLRPNKTEGSALKESSDPEKGLRLMSEREGGWLEDSENCDCNA